MEEESSNSAGGISIAVGYPHSSTSISISKNEYFILVIEILYSISISHAPVLSLSHTLYPLFHILFPSLPLLSLPNSLSLLLQCLACVHSAPLGIARVPAGRYAPARDTGARCGRAHATAGVPAGLQVRSADSLMLQQMDRTWVSGR